jgi:hypothetical protein
MTLIGCTNCKLRIAEWRRLIQTTDTLFAQKTDFLFFFQPKTNGLKELELLLK